MPPPADAPPPSEDPLVGVTLLGKLLVIRRLGAGGRGVVYEVEHQLTRHRRALKVLHPEHASSVEAVARLVREARVGGKLDAAFVAETYDVGRLPDGSPYILMELLRGESVRAWLDRVGRLTAGDAVRLAVEVCEGLAAVHAAGIIHRDLKPENLFVAAGEDGVSRVKLLDFGMLAFEAGAGDTFGALTVPGGAPGTPVYMAPEQLDGSAALDARVDVYALGVVLYEALAGRLPFEGAGLAAVLAAGDARRVPPLEEVAPEVAPALADVVRRAMSRDREARPPTARALRDALIAVAPGATARDAPPSPQATPSPPVTPRRREVAELRLGAAEGSYLASRFEVVRLLSEGGMGAVYEVIHRETRRRRALKVMLPGLVGDSALRARFELEARIAADVESDHIVEIFDAGVDPITDTPFLVMELLKGEDLGALLARRGRVPAAEVVTLLGQAARALDRTHAAGIVHRDLKPGNLFLTRRDDGTPHLKILDFGIAKVLAESPRGIAATRGAIGTPLYMAPEQARGGAGIGPASDLHALAHIAFTLLVGEPYFQAEARRGGRALLAQVALGPTEPASTRAARLGVTLPAAFDAWFARAAALEAEERFSPASHLVATLAEALAVAAPVAAPALPGDDRTARDRVTIAPEQGLAPTVLAPFVGRKLGPYRLVRRLGAGGFAPVWLAEEEYEGTALRPVAVKLFSLDRAMDADASGPEARERRPVIEEARLLCRVAHPNVVRFYSLAVDEERGLAGLAMEYLDGAALDRRLREVGHAERAPPGGLPLEDTLAIGVAVASALAAVHREGLLHRDVKPANVVEAGGVHKLIDFGIAAAEAPGARAAPTGTVGYIDPACLAAGAPATAASDLYALGALLFECATGWLPAAAALEGKGLASEVLDGRAPASPLRRFAPAAPPSLCALVDGLLAPEPAGRPASAEIVARALQDIQEEHAAGRASALDPSVSRSSPTSAAAGGAGRARRRTTARLGVAGVALALACAGVGAWRARAARPGAPIAPASPLVAPASRIACPALRASGVDEPAGWLGAAAASIVCERARLVLGGRPERTLLPAELLDLPRAPGDGFPEDPYGQPGAWERAQAAAHARGAVVITGEVIAASPRFRVSLEARDAGGAELGRASGEGRGLPEAVRAAMDPLVASGVLPRATALDPVVRDWSRATDVDGALALLDLTLAIANNAGELPDECARAGARREALPELVPAALWRCAYTLGLAAPRFEPPSLDPPGAEPAVFAARARSSLMVNAKADFRAAATHLHGVLEREPSPWGRAQLASTESCLLQPTDPERSREMALVAVQAEPKNPDGALCSPWQQLLWATLDTSSAESVLRAMQAWEPWDSNAWSQSGASTDAATARRNARRAYVITPFDTSAATALADLLLSAGEREGARGIALALLAGGHPVHRAASDLLLVRIEASEARFGAALARATRALESSPEDGGYVRVQRLELAWRALEIAELLGRAREEADLLVARFVDPEPPPLDGIYVSVPMRLVAMCALASPDVSRRCFTRFRALQGRGLFTSNVPGTETFVEGAERYARGDWPGAAKAWRPLLRSPGLLASVMPAAMAAVFEKSGDLELVERLDAGALAGGGEYNGANPAHVRAARRAARRGDKARAQALARQVVAAWSVADETAPALAEMRRLLPEP
jgi:serine/threonine protein kinase